MQQIYLNTAAAGLVPAAVTAAANKLYETFVHNASAHAEKWRDETQPLIRRHVAEFLSAPVENIALVPNFSWGINGIVHSLRGDEKVMLYKGDYPSLLDPFKLNGFDISWAEDEDGFTIPPDRIKQQLLDQRVDILAISHVQWMSGFKLDLADIATFCKEHGIRLIVDATQSLGAVPTYISAQPVDVLIASNYKWMNAGFGTGIMYISDSFLQEYTPAVAGFNSYTFIDGKPQYIPGVRSYEPGHPNMYGYSVLDAAVQHKMQVGMEHIEEHNMALTQLLLDEIKGANVQLLGDYTINNRTSFVLLKERNNLAAMLKDNGIVATNRMGLVRISFHYYNTKQDVAKVAELLKAV